MARQNRAYLQRVVHFMIDHGVRQFLDIGSGFPTQGNVHEVAQRADPDIPVVYVDKDERVVLAARDKLRDNRNATIIGGDLREPGSILDHPDTQRLIDFGQPLGLLMIAIWHFVKPAEQPLDLMYRYVERLAPGSFVALSHVTLDNASAVFRPQAEEARQSYDEESSSPLTVRTRAEFTRFFIGLNIVAGVTYAADCLSTDPNDTDDPARLYSYAAVGQKP